MLPTSAGAFAQSRSTRFEVPAKTSSRTQGRLLSVLCKNAHTSRSVEPSKSSNAASGQPQLAEFKFQGFELLVCLRHVDDGVVVALMEVQALAKVRCLNG